MGLYWYNSMIKYMQERDKFVIQKIMNNVYRYPPPCYGLNICVSPKLTCWNLSPQSAGNRTWGFGEDNLESSWVWQCPYKRDSRELSLLTTIWGYSRKTAVYEPGIKLSLDPKLPAHWSWTFQHLEKSLLFVSHAPYGILLQQSEQTKTSFPKVEMNLPTAHSECELGLLLSSKEWAWKGKLRVEKPSKDYFKQVIRVSIPGDKPCWYQVLPHMCHEKGVLPLILSPKHTTPI